MLPTRRHHQMPGGGRVKRKAGSRTRREPLTKEVAANLQRPSDENLEVFFLCICNLSGRRIFVLSLRPVNLKSMRSVKKLILMMVAMLSAVGMIAQDATYKFTGQGLIKTVVNENGTVEQYNVLKPIVLFKSKYELSTTNGEARFSVRHATLGTRGQISSKLSYCYHIDFSTENKITVLDLYARFTPTGRWTITLGQQYHPLFNSWTVAPNDVDYINRPFVGKYFASSRDIGITAKYALKKEGFPINLEYGVYNGSGINNPTWNGSMVQGGRVEFGSMKKGFRATAKYFSATNAQDSKDLYWGVDMRYACDAFKVESEVMTKNISSERKVGAGPVYEPGSLSAAYVQALYKIKAKGNTLKRIEPLLRWDAMGYDMKDRGFGVNRVTAGLNFVLNTSYTSMFRINYEQYFNNSMDMSALYKEPHYNHNKLSFELLLYFL